MAVGGGKRMRLWIRPDVEEDGAGVEDLGPVRLVDPAGDFDLDLWRDFDLLFPFGVAGFPRCLAASSSAAAAAAFSCSVVGMTPELRVSNQNCPRAVLWPEPLRSFWVLWVFLVLDMWHAKLKSFSLFLMYSL